MADRAGHITLVVNADFPLCPTEAGVAVAATAQICGSIHRHGLVGVVCRSRAVAGFTGNTILLPGGSGWIISGDVADQTGTWFTLGCPGIGEYRVRVGMTVSTGVPGSLKIGVAFSSLGNRRSLA